jgi:hypothetical protein
LIVTRNGLICKVLASPGQLQAVVIVEGPIGGDPDTPILSAACRTSMPSLILELAPAAAAEDVGEQVPRDSDLGHLECDVAFVPGNLDAILISFWPNVVIPLRQRECFIRVISGSFQ